MFRTTRFSTGWALVCCLLTAGCLSDGDPADRSFGWNPPSAGRPSLPDSPINLELSLARTLEREGGLKQAAAAYQQILARHPRQPVATHRLAIVFDRQQRFDESRRLFEQALALTPDNPDLMCDYAYSLYTQRELAAAEELLRKSLSIAPGHARSHNHLGLVLARTDRREEAMREFHAAGCSMSEAQENIGLVLSLDGQLPEARAAYASALEAAPGSESIQARLNELDAVASFAATQTATGNVAATEADRATDSHHAPPDSKGRAVIQLTGGVSL